jgi:hypothetical protein
LPSAAIPTGGTLNSISGTCIFGTGPMRPVPIFYLLR